ncbi:hypothetical protein DH2020_003234 [Rehmannia glutinosa]|uniref:Kinesin-like protein n=1 Tax=Rehmannia glutinosa TaxID=99300 RepID=A0ABR0XLH1_REHGL
MAEGVLQFDVASVVEDVLQQHGKRLCDIDLASRKAEEACEKLVIMGMIIVWVICNERVCVAALRRYEAAGWLRKMAGVVGGKDLPAQPSEEEFRLGLRSGIMLCNVLNKVQPGSVPKVVEAPSDTGIIPDGAALSAYQYFENIRNFLDSIEEMGIPAFEASDLEQEGKSSRIVNCVLALKSYNDWKQGGGKGVWKFGGNSKPPSGGKQFVRKNSDLFINSLSRNASTGEKSLDSLSTEQNPFCDLGQDETGTSHSLHVLVRELLSDKKQEDIPTIVENMLSKVMEEFEHRLASQSEKPIRTTLRDTGVPSSNKREEIEVIEELKNTLHSTKEDMQMLSVKYQEEVNNLGKHLNSLAHAASGYQKVLEENRKLYNQVQDLKEEVFSDTQPLIRSVLDGFNVCIFAYGQTGSGKLIQWALSDLFLISEQRKDSICYDVSVQMIEIYNEQVRDLLVTDEIRNNSQNGVNVPNANLVPVTTPSEVLNLMNLGHKNRAVGSTAMNDRSSRSHSCLTVHVQGRDLTSGSILRGCMHLVDLAGSERADKTEAVGDRLKEAQHINRSLSALGDVISSLAQKQSHVPYRNSKLTQLLQDSLGGQAKTLMFVHISPEPDALAETISTLKFAERVSTVELGAARSNKESTDVKELKEQIASLKAALSRKERGESGIQQSGCISPDGVIIRSFGSSPSDSSWQSSKAESGSIEEQCVTSDWVDKVMVKKQGHDHIGKWDEDGRQSPDMFYQKVYPEQSLNKITGHRRHSLDNGLGRHETDDSDDLEAETSDSSEIDYQWQLNVAKSNGVPNGVGSKIRRPSPKQTKSTEIRFPVVMVDIGFSQMINWVHVRSRYAGKKSAEMSQTEVHQMKQKQQPIPLGTLIGRELRNEKVEAHSEVWAGCSG